MCGSPENDSADEHEITPEMVSAGLCELYAYGPEHSCVAEDVVRDIFDAMMQAHQKQVSPKRSGRAHR